MSTRVATSQCIRRAAPPAEAIIHDASESTPAFARGQVCPNTRHHTKLESRLMLVALLMLSGGIR